MALAASCPHCRALFRVVADQLKLRGGLVRCGACRHVFDAIGSLSYVDDHALMQKRAEAPIGGAALPGPAVVAAPASRPQRPRETVAPAPAKPAAPAGYRNVLVTPETGPPGTATRPQEEASELEAPSFLPTESQVRQQRITRALAIACIPLSLLAAIQIGLAMRDDALEAWPSPRPTLLSACRLYACKVAWPAHAELLTIIGSELAAIPGTDVIELNAALRSRANFIMGLPALEVTLTDTLNRTIARKVFLPVDYLASSGEPSSRIDDGLAPCSDLSVRLVFEARGLNAAGFVLYPFYL